MLVTGGSASAPRHRPLTLQSAALHGVAVQGQHSKRVKAESAMPLETCCRSESQGQPGFKEWGKEHYLLMGEVAKYL